MARPAVGEALRRCAACGGYEYSGGLACAACRQLVDGIVEEEWRSFLHRWSVGKGQEAELAEMVVDEPDRHDWRVVDAALDRLACAECGDRLSRGPIGCPACDLAHGFRYAAIETDRPGVVPGNEHAIRVNVSVVRRPHVTSANEVLARRLLLPVLLVGYLPTIDEAQRISALIKRSPPAQKILLLEETIEGIKRQRARNGPST
ncbi:hypothetical protein GCM10012275_54450 [Longimycelium tulufanense]|uniref:Uncharacterized protein n=1 Tax=Longimycelium tulufanense TaxID=907463 RepID=A0A8J3CH86_9PSEU|nr:hypothetical protein [Longimycelium tulufanense]GGM76884.1 hypothetical protein GCM10012275_54450 [Longimycelium tulufanense]